MKPLENITILEFSTMVTASFAAMMLAEQGARVIKVEPTEAGDPMRSIGTSKGGMSGLFASCNRGKQSVCIDIKQERGQAVARELASRADVVIHNFRPGVMDKLNLGSNHLRETNPRLVYMAISGFGSTGPMSAAPAYDPVIQAHTGMAASQGTGEPAFIRNLMCDKITAYTACQAVTSALYMRERTGEGQHIDLSMLDSGLFFMFPDAFMNHTLLAEDASPQPLLADLLYQMTLTSDGGITLSAANERQRLGVLKALGKEDMRDDPRFSTMESLIANIDEYLDIMREGFHALTTDEAIKKLRENDVPCAKCLSLDEVLEQPQLASNNSLEIQEHPSMGSLRMIRSPARFGGKELATGGPSPGLGEHTVEVLREIGLDGQGIESLSGAGVVSRGGGAHPH